jgi:sporulation integral membrane protein YtvI
MLTMKEYAKRIFVAVIIIAATLIVPYLLYLVLPHFIPFVLAYFTAACLDPMINWLSKKLKTKKAPAVTLTYVLFLATGGFLIYLVINKLYVQLLGLLAFIQSSSPKLQVWFLSLLEQIQNTMGLLPHDVGEQINLLLVNAINELTNLNLVAKVGGYTYSLSTAIPNFFFLFLIYIISVYLFCLQLDNIRRGFYSLFKDSSKRKVIFVLSDLRKATFGFLKAQVILSTITFIISFVGLLILNVKYAAVMAFIIVLVDILPILGTGSVLLPWAIFSFFQDNLFLAVGLCILFVLIIVIRRAIEPKVLGERIGLSALATLVSIWIGFKVMGILGIFLFPLALIFYKALTKVGIINIHKIKF